ncbi:hypothetical protein L798_04192 [Zootermopsis nevadensis]|uniref:Uncharacterized protein n=1 Tax=Zootermopsis nevadensis TaxID=136037 RepID=A0A067QFU8_ZOONE|nr:hypothetical protein L798_04192 [Zootermopsis nevadensis]
MSEGSFSQIGSLSTLNDSVNSQIDDSSNILTVTSTTRAVSSYDYGNYRQMQPNSTALPVESSRSETAERKRPHINGKQRNRRSMSENSLSQIGSLNLMNESVNTQTRGSSNILEHTGDYERDNVQIIKNKTFSQPQFENEDQAHSKLGQNGVELSRGRASANNVRHQKHQNIATTEGYRMMPKRVRIWDGE